MSNIRIFSTGASDGAVALSNKLRELGAKSTKVSFTSKTISFGKNDLILNWGSSAYPKWLARKVKAYAGVLNLPEYVGLAINKVSAFDCLKEIGVSIPGYAIRMSDIPPEWKTVVCRALIKGSRGEGIEVFNNGNIMADYPLYVEYIKKSKEYRVHVFNGAIIDVQEKRKRVGFEGEFNSKIRNISNGWVFCRENVEPPLKVLEEALAAVEAMSLDFGAVDIIWNKHYDRAYVLEINTAPGIEGATIDAYASAVLQYSRELIGNSVV
jgi:glutathione synthase/RimK-type ligase-like ATP-grasp enzyme